MNAEASDRASEWPSLRLGLLAATAVLTLVLVGGGTAALLEDDASRLELVERCLRREKLLEVGPATGDPIAAEAGGGAVATRVEGNGLHLAIAGSEKEAARLAGTYRSVSGPLTGKLEQRRVYVLVWEGVATPTQRQTVYDCLVY